MSKNDYYQLAIEVEYSRAGSKSDVSRGGVFEFDILLSQIEPTQKGSI